MQVTGKEKMAIEPNSTNDFAENATMVISCQNAARVNSEQNFMEK